MYGTQSLYKIHSMFHTFNDIDFNKDDLWLPLDFAFLLENDNYKPKD